jgi:hypothetical protein
VPLERAHVHISCEAQPIRFVFGACHTRDLADARISELAADEGLLDAWQPPQGATHADAFARFSRTETKQCAHRIQLVAETPEASVVPDANAIRQVGEVTADEPLGVALHE